ncbi:hypothetical protein MNBD_NITROSPINAE02-113 [hydrothermal vent metagenome]|uniref:SGNH hydrolase-type esterase domain-containing protein n=1 Tax=hydrothermal vent metagenome TaxID=652676 RepID=A0A3B1C810_9ZZZZ
MNAPKSPRVLLVADTVLRGLVALCGSVAIYTLWYHDTYYVSPKGALVYGVTPATCALLLLLCLKLEVNRRINIALLLVTTFSAFYFLETVNYTLEYRKDPDFIQNYDSYRTKVTPVIIARQKLAKRIEGMAGMKLQALELLSRAGVDIESTVAPMTFIREGKTLEIEGQPITPLGGMSNTPTLYCSELGYWALYNSDEHGYNNPMGLWSKDTIDIIAVGDSFLHGACVHQGSDIVSHLRTSYPNSLNLGYAGNSPQLELATISEYARPLKPKVVLWFYFEGNDLEDVIRHQTPIMERYLADPLFTQGLLGKQGDIDAQLHQYVSREMEKSAFVILNADILDRQVETEVERLAKSHPMAPRHSEATIRLVKKHFRDTMGPEGALIVFPRDIEAQLKRYHNITLGNSKPPRHSLGAHIKRIVKLTSLRMRIGLVPKDHSSINLKEGTSALLDNKYPVEEALDRLRRFLSAAATRVRSWGGELVFIYLPEFRETYKSANAHYRPVIDIARSLSLPTVDIQQAFAAHEDAHSFFPFRLPGHYNERGYRFVAEKTMEILDRIDMVKKQNGARTAITEP